MLRLPDIMSSATLFQAQTQNSSLPSVFT